MRKTRKFTNLFYLRILAADISTYQKRKQMKGVNSSNDARISKIPSESGCILVLV